MANNDPARQATYTRGPVARHVAHLSTVMIFGFLAMTLGQLVELVYVGQLGTQQLAAITYMFPITMALNALTRGIGIGASTIIAQAMGESNRDKTARTITHCYILVLMFTCSIAIAGYLAAETVFRGLGAQSAVLTLAVNYSHIWFIGFPCMGIAMVSNGLIRSFGNATYPGFIMASAPLVQVMVGPFLIFGWFGIPALGLMGAAWAFVIGSLLQLLLAAYWYLIKEALLHASLQGFYQSSSHILIVGIPAAATNLIQPLSTAFATWILSQFGTDIVAGFGVASRIEAVAGMVVIGISTSVVPLVGQNWGARQFDRVQQALTICYIACIIWGLIAAIVLWFGASFFVGSINDDPDLMDTAVTFLHIIPISIGFMGLITVANHAFNALRQPMPALILSIGRLLIVYVPLALVGSYLYGYVGVFAATALANILVGVFAVYWYQKVMTRSRRQIEQEIAGNVFSSGSLHN